jgi:hypothetical protein
MVLTTVTEVRISNITLILHKLCNYHLLEVSCQYTIKTKYSSFLRMELFCLSTQLIIFTSLSQTSPTGTCREFTQSFPSLMDLSYSTYSVPLHSLFLQNLLYLFFPCLSGSSFGSLHLCPSLPGWVLGYLSPPILTIYPNHLNSANSVIPLKRFIPNPILIVLFLILSLLVSLF